MPGVKSALPLIEGQVMVSSNVQALGGLVRGIEEKSLKSLTLVADNVKLGTIEGFDGQTGIAMGSRLANSLRVSLGDTVTLVSPRGAATPFGNAPRSKPYVISSIFELGMSEYDRMMIFMPLAEAQKYFAKGTEVDVLEVVVDQPDQVGATPRRSRRRRAPTWASPTGARATRRSSPCSKSSATPCSSSCR